MPRAANNNGIDSAAVVTVKPTAPCGASLSPASPTTPRLVDYLERRCAEGKTKTEAIRCLKRYVARELYACLPREDWLDST